MWSVSQEFLSELSKGAQQPIFRAELLSQGVVVPTDLRIVDGRVDVDPSASVSRRRCSVTIVDPSGVLIPQSANDPLSPYGYEIRLWRGYRLSTGDEMVPLGTFRIAEVRVKDKGFPTVEVQGYDRARAMSRYRFESPYSIASGTNYMAAITDLIKNRLGQNTSIDLRKSTTGTTPLLVFEQMADPWHAVQGMATSTGSEVFFDPMGTCVIRNEPNPSTDPITYRYSEGVNATVLSVENNLTDEPGYNGVVVDGEPVDLPPVRSVAWDTDPNSPTYYLGRYGKVPKFLRSIFIRTQAQADEAAAAELRRSRGGTENLTFSAIPNPAHEAGDTVQIVRSSIGISDLYLLTSFSIPLDLNSPMTPQTRKRRSV